FNPVTNEMFIASAGGGATLNGKRLHVTATPTLDTAVLGTGFPYNRATNPENNFQLWNTFMIRSRDVRRFGSAALDLCYVAAGRFDAFWEAWLNPWDCIAGIVCVREAGGLVTDYQGGEENLTGRDLVASNGLLHAEMLRVIAEDH
ncbi:MAG: inositol monophosphatase, partial [Anaerolineae bacterium]|nr:inositol monophosphatase [Anaerolineae bacterium]